ncbi:hypothetical protein CkaCkLH20_05492 [Colletotrichum karsti]|uniref:Uncharacterized protein n=1 Tax=Colletotrichum karsti TaxID=1095194 RepID=A0A9P6I8Q7_9PEZI|nr:uncharacterized protein CkaCkLH20_05492 [Colletotrichum karsti]KAF9877226.1 hypothetical protein CkaCkLH20_05492 [Colletotrichum karsti]
MASRNDKATQGDVAEPPKNDTVEPPNGDQRSNNHSSDSRLSDAETNSTSDSNALAIDGHKSNPDAIDGHKPNPDAIDGHKSIADHPAIPAGTMAKFPSQFYARKEHVKINRKNHVQFLLCPSFRRDDPELFNVFHERMKHAEKSKGSFRFSIADGPIYSDPVLAKADGVSRVGHLRSKGGNTFNITLPPLGSLPESEIKLGSVMSTLTNGVRNLGFKIDIDGKTETFEWRQTRGREVKLTHRVHEGWKLVRTSRFKPEMGGERKKRVYGFSSDGAEILAILSKKKYVKDKESKEEKTDRAAWKEKKAKEGPRIKHGRYMFTFMGKGLTGTLGQRWETMAVISGHILWLAHRDEPSKALLVAGAVVAIIVVV